MNLSKSDRKQIAWFISGLLFQITLIVLKANKFLNISWWFILIPLILSVLLCAIVLVIAAWIAPNIEDDF